MLAEQRADVLRRAVLETILRGDSFSSRGPHVGDVEVLGAIVVVIEAADAHSRAHIFDARLLRNVGECAVSVVPIKILSSEIVDDVQVGPTVAVVIAPAAAKTIASVVLIEAGLRRDIAKA